MSTQTKHVYRIRYQREGIHGEKDVLASNFDSAIEKFNCKTMNWKDVELLSVNIVVANLDLS